MNNSLHQQKMESDANLNQNVSPLQAHSIMGSNPVSVCCRLKPILFNQEKANIHVDMKDHAIIISEDSKQITKTFAFDQIFDQTVCQHKFTRTICDPLIQFLKNDGNGGLIFSYGVTNSGKTHSILGNIENPGVLYYLIKKLQDQFGNGSVRITAFQLYNDEFFSLKNKEKMTPKQFCGFLEFDQYEPDTILAENMEAILKQYMSNRSQGDTKFNPKSSRSHAIFKIQCKNFKIGVVDLAGSQRAKAGPGQKINQTIAINKSLLLLGRCIQALKDKKKNSNIRIPFRESKLTQVLMEYFTTGYKIRIIANVNQAKTFYHQNIQVLEYTSIAKNITNNSSSQFAHAIKSARKKYELIKSNFKAQKQKSNLKTNFKAKVTINQQDLVINEETFQNQQRDTEFRRLLVYSEKKRIGQLLEAKELQKAKQLSETKNIAMNKSNEIMEDIDRTQKAFSMFLDFQHAKQSEQDRKFLSNLRKVNLFQSEKKIVDCADIGINTEGNDFFNCDIDQLATGLKKRLKAQFQSQRKRQIIRQNAQIQTCFSQKKQFKTPMKTIEIQDDQNQSEIQKLICQEELNSVQQVAESTEYSSQDRDFLNKTMMSIIKPAFTIYQTGKKMASMMYQSLKKGQMPNFIKNTSNIKQRKTNLKARKFNIYQTNEVIVLNQKRQEEQNQEQLSQGQSVKQIQFKQVWQREQENHQACNQDKVFNDQATIAVVQVSDAQCQTESFLPQKPIVKFYIPDHQKKKNMSNKKELQYSMQRKKILKNKTPMKYNPPTPIAKRTRHIRRNRNF